MRPGLVAETLVRRVRDGRVPSSGALRGALVGAYRGLSIFRAGKVPPLLRPVGRRGPPRFYGI